MPAHFTQKDRQGRLTTTLGEDTLVLLRMDGVEELSGDFEWRVEALSEDATLNIEALLGTHATVEIDMMQGTRAFDGIVCEASHRGAFENGWRYDLVLRPWLHVASLRRNMRIFHQKTVVQIVEEVLATYADLGSPHIETQLTADYPKLEYTVQYGESDAQFIRRQLERFGITWSWRHEAGSHTLLLSDAAFSLPEVPGGKRPFFGVDGHHQADEEHFRRWTASQRITTGAVRLTEYNFKTPSAAQEVDQLGDAAHPHGDVESYDWPGDYLDQGEGRGVLDKRLEAERGQAPRHYAQGDVISLGAGWRVTLSGDEVQGATGDSFVCLKAEHRYRAQAYGSGDTGGDERAYDGSYVLMPEDTPMRPERRTPGAKVQGPETAVVVGEGEIDCDEHGRILVRFHWDLEGAHSMRVRVSQNWASKGWGGMVIPRIGMEVIVEHLRGDPDKPIVTGCVYNGKNVPPNQLPTYKTRSIFQTDSHQGSGYNELRFEDESGQEEIWMQAQKYLNVFIKDNETWKTEGSQDFHVSGSSSQDIDGDKDMKVQGDHREQVTGSRHIEVTGSRITHTKISDLATINGDRATQIDSTDDTFIGESMRLETGGAQYNKVGTTHFIDAGSDIVLTAGATISLNVGGNFIKIDAMGVTINGTLTKINSGGSAKKGKKVSRAKPTKPKKYAGPHATRYGRSFKE